MRQFVDSEYCLRCKGCCRFYRAEWAPQLLSFEKKTLGVSQIELDVTPDYAYCRFLRQEDYHCRIYRQRPFECLLYPFLLTRREQTLDLAVHLACPYVQEGLDGSGLDAYAGYIKDQLRAPEIYSVLQSESGIFSVYPENEIRIIKPDILGRDAGAGQESGDDRAAAG